MGKKWLSRPVLSWTAVTVLAVSAAARPACAQTKADNCYVHRELFRGHASSERRALYAGALTKVLEAQLAGGTLPLAIGTFGKANEIMTIETNPQYEASLRYIMGRWNTGGLSHSVCVEGFEKTVFSISVSRTDDKDIGEIYTDVHEKGQARQTDSSVLHLPAENPANNCFVHHELADQYHWTAKKRYAYGVLLDGSLKDIGYHVSTYGGNDQKYLNIETSVAQQAEMQRFINTFVPKQSGRLCVMGFEKTVFLVYAPGSSDKVLTEIYTNVREGEQAIREGAFKEDNER